MAHASNPDGLAAVLAILVEAQALLFDVYSLKKEKGESSANIFAKTDFLKTLIEELEEMVTKMRSDDIMKYG